MVAMYNPQDADYTDELSVRHEISRVFDVCFSCQKCVETCAVFPQLVTAIEGCQGKDSSLLTPEQQDNIIDTCHQCLQCVVQCPHSEATTHEASTSSAIRFPELLIRHRTMLWSQGFVTVRQKLSSVLLILWPFVARRVSLLWRFNFARRAVRSIVSSRASLPSLIEASSIWPRVKNRKTQTSSGDIVVFPTCVVNEFQPELVNDFVEVSHVLRRHCSESSSLVCCGAPALYAGDMRRFRRIVKRNISRLSPRVQDGSTVVVGQAGCLGVMKQYYPVVAPSSKTDMVVASLRDMTEFLVDTITQSDTISLGSDVVSPIVILQGSTQVFSGVIPTVTDDDDQLVDVHHNGGAFAKYATRVTPHVSVKRYPSVADTVWSCQDRFHDDIASGVDSVAQHLCNLGSETEPLVLGDGVMAGMLIAERSGSEVIHPVSWIARQFIGSRDAGGDSDTSR